MKDIDTKTIETHRLILRRFDLCDTRVINYLLDECEVHIVEAKHHSTNPASGRVMEKAGMIKEAVLKDRRYDVFQ